jgi:DNA-3-methyladenine glycosylase
VSSLSNLRPLDRAFFARTPRRVARELLGKVLVRELGESRLAARVVEVEAYLGERDPASHAFPGLTPRNAVMFGAPGFAYVYFIYGVHYCLNVSCQREGLEPLVGLAEMARERKISLDGPADLRKLTSGPGRLAEAFGVTRIRDNGCDLTAPASGLWIGDDGFRAGKILTTPRIGITKAAEHRLRYVLAGNAFVSGKKVRVSD